jgi:hypothetical protein
MDRTILRPPSVDQPRCALNLHQAEIDDIEQFVTTSHLDRIELVQPQAKLLAAAA